MRSWKLKTPNLRGALIPKFQSNSWNQTEQNLSRASAFTLIELVISAALMALILTAAYMCLNAAISGQKLIEPRAEVIQTARVIMGMISADLRSACPLSKDYEFLGMHRMLGDVQADNLDFATHNYSPKRANEGDFCEVSYFAQKESEDDTGRVSLWRRRNPTIAPDPLSGGNREQLARGLRGVSFEYFDGFDWYDTWGEIADRKKKIQSDATELPPNLSGMPEAVRVTLWFDPNPRPPKEGEVRSEPPLVFQTVVRLNLSAASQSGLSSGSAPTSSPDSGSPGTQTPGANQ